MEECFEYLISKVLFPRVLFCDSRRWKRTLAYTQNPNFKTDSSIRNCKQDDDSVLKIFKSLADTIPFRWLADWLVSWHSNT